MHAPTLAAPAAPEPDAQPLFCAAPWLEAVVRMDGTVLPCCRSDRTFGNVGDAPLSAVWRGTEAVAFRADIVAGRHPSAICAACHRARKHTTPAKIIDPLIDQFWAVYADAQRRNGGRPYPALCRAMPVFRHALRDGDPRTLPPAADAVVTQLAHAISGADTDAAIPLRRLYDLAVAVVEFCTGVLLPSRVAVLREVSLVAVCNARCLHCVGLYNDEIRSGQWVGGRRRKRMDDATLAAALDSAEDIASFFVNGSEFLLYPDWRGLLQRFERHHVQVAIATNGLLMDADAIATIARSRAVRDLNFSFDGATAPTVERIRRPVRFDALCTTVRRFLDELHSLGRSVPVSMSMVLMRDNRHEARALVELAHALGSGMSCRPHVSFQVLDANPQPEYEAFRATQYTDLDDPETMASLCAANTAAIRLGVGVFYTYQGSLARVLDGERQRRIATPARDSSSPIPT